MKQEYKYENGEITAYDDKEGFIDSIEYQDNIKDIFIKENIIEQIEEDIPLLKNEIANIKKHLKKLKKTVWVPVIGLFLTSLLAPSFTVYIISSAAKVSFATIDLVATVSLSKMLTLFFCPVFTVIGGLMSYENYHFYKNKKKELNGKTTEVELLEKDLKEEKESLEILKQDKRKDKEEKIKNNPKQKIDNKTYLNYLKDIRALYFDIGYNEQKYIKYYNKNKLNKKMKKYYSDESIEIIEKEIKEKVKSLNKEKKN